MDKVCAHLVPEGETLNGEHIRNLFFGNYIEPDADPKIYDEVSRKASKMSAEDCLSSLSSFKIFLKFLISLYRT